MGSTIHRTTISIPQDLKEQMDAIGDQVNWSAVATSAFQAKVNEIKARKAKKMAKADVVKRLKSLREAEDQETYNDGKEAGREWAERYAKPRELKRIAEYLEASDRETNSWSWWDVDYPGWNHFGATGAFAFAARPKDKDDRDAADSFWEEALGEDSAELLKDADFFRGFGDGVAEVWDEVSTEL
jgi:hypothetical protein